jgi:hypothetical protein
MCAIKKTLDEKCESYAIEPTEKMKCYQQCMPANSNNPTGFPYGRVVTGKSAPFQNNANGAKSKTHTDMRCGQAFKLDVTQGGTSRCKAGCSKCDAFFTEALVPFYGNGNGQLPDDFEGCFQYNVKWPCRTCQGSTANPHGGTAGGAGGSGGGSGGSSGSGCAQDFGGVECLDGFQACPNDVPKCFSNSLSVPKGDECAPIPTAVCGGGGAGGVDNGNSDGGNGASTGNGGNGAGENTDEGEEGEDGDGKGTPTTHDDGNEEEEKDEDGDGDGNEQIKDLDWPDKEYVKWPKKPCTDCASAFFKCHDAQCDSWDCKWWCRCYKEGVDYVCKDDGSPCDCDAFGKSLYDLTYDDLLESPYMDVKFTGAGAEELNKQAECIRDPNCEL